MKLMRRIGAASGLIGLGIAASVVAAGSATAVPAGDACGRIFARLRTLACLRICVRERQHCRDEHRRRASPATVTAA